MQCKVTCYQAESNVHQLNTLRYVSCLKTRTKDNLIGCHKLAENFFQPLTISGTKQSKRPRKDILCFEDLDTNDTAALQCYHLLFPCGIFLQVSSRGVYNLNDSFSWEKRTLKSVLHGHLNYSLFQDYEAAANKHLYFHTGGVQEWDAGTQPHAQGVVSVQRNPQDCEAESAQFSSEQGKCLCWVVIPHLALSQKQSWNPRQSTHTTAALLIRVA